MHVLRLWVGSLLLLLAGCTQVYHLDLEPSDVLPPLCLCASATDACAPCYDATSDSQP